MIIFVEISRWIAFVIAVLLFEKMAEHILYPKLRKSFSVINDYIVGFNRISSTKGSIKIAKNYRKTVLHRDNTSLFVSYCHSRQAMHTANMCIFSVIVVGNLIAHA